MLMWVTPGPAVYPVPCSYQIITPSVHHRNEHSQVCIIIVRCHSIVQTAVLTLCLEFRVVYAKCIWASFSILKLRVGGSTLQLFGTDDTITPRHLAKGELFPYYFIWQTLVRLHGGNRNCDYVSLQYYKYKANFGIHTVYHVDMFCGSQNDKRVSRILFFLGF